MVKVYEIYWVFRLCQFVKYFIKWCYGCKRFYVLVFVNFFLGNLFIDRIEGILFFQVVGIDYVGLIKYCDSKNKEGKVYIVLYVCSLL